jgi:tRNA uridine 5-carbamoylmethylation protein Kti12
MLRVTILKGLPASGKTTWAMAQLKQNVALKRVSKDDLRAMLDGGKWSGANEKFILIARDRLILAALEVGHSVLVDDTNLVDKHRLHIQELVRGKAEVVIQDFTDVPLETCLQRDRERPNAVGERVIRRMYRDYLAPTSSGESR